MKFSEIYKRIQDAQLCVDDMHDYQHMGVDFILKKKKCALFIDLGMGKSGIAATAAEILVSSLQVDKVLIIAPLLVANSTWPEQFETWRQLAGHDFELLSAEKDRPHETKAEAICRRSRDSKASFHFVQKDMVHVLVDFWRRKWPYQMIIIDESSKVKDHSTQIFKKLNLLYDFVEYMVELTATPAAEGYIGLFSQMALLDRGERLGTKITHYREDYFKQDIYTRKWKPLKGAEDKIDELISDITLVMKAKQYLADHNDPEFVEHKIPMSTKFMKQYNDMEKESVLTLGDVDIVADNAAAVWSKLLQMASGMIYETWDTPHPTRVGVMKRNRKSHHLHDAKLDELEELVDQLDGKPLLVGYYWEESLARLKERFPYAAVIDKEGKYKARWDSGKIKMLLAHPMSAGHGLNLQKPTNHMAFYDLHPSLENFLQFIGRINRQGQKLQVYVHLMLAKGTYDMRVWESLKNKQDGQDRLLNRLRRMQRKYREDFMKLFHGG